MNQNFEFLEKTLQMFEDPGPVGQLVSSGAVYGYKRATKLGYEPIIILDIRSALDQGYQ